MLLLLPVAFALQVSIKVESSREAPRAADTTQADSAARNRRPPRRIPLTPELISSAYRDAEARTLLLKARDARLKQDSALLSYDATSYQRISVGLGVKAFGRDRLLFRTESVGRVRWGRGVGARVDVKGKRTVFPMFGSGEADVDDIAPIPYFPGMEELWIGGGVAKAEVDERELIHPIATGSEAYYRYATGDSITYDLPDGKSVRLQELRVEPRRPEWKLSVGSFWFDKSSGQLVRAVYRFATEMDIWAVAKEENKIEREDAKQAGRKPHDDDDPPKWVTAMLSPMKANLEAVTIEYGLYEGRFWLPRARTAEGWAQASFMRIPVKLQESFKYASVNGRDSVPPLPPIAAPLDSMATRARRDSMRAERERVRAMSPAERQQYRQERARADSARATAEKLARKRQCDSTGTYTRTRTRYDGSLRVAVAMPCDSTLLAKSPDLPASIYEPGEDLFGDRERDELLKSLGFGLQPEWAPQKPVVHYGLDLTRYNRVEGLSLGVDVKETLGRGYTAELIPRLGFADLQPNAELMLRRTNGRRDVQVGAYRRLAAANDWGDPLSFGSSLSTFLYGRDEGFYYRAAGGELLGRSSQGGGLTWRLFAEHDTPARVETEFSLAKAISNSRFMDNIDATRGTFAGAAVRLDDSFGLDPRGWRLLTGLRAEAAGGTSDYVRGMFDATVSRAIGGSAAGALTLSAGAAGGTVPAQRLWYLGGTHTVRGEDAGAASGDAFWLARAELGTALAGVRPVVFGDLGWAGNRDAWQHPGRPLSGAGAGLSFLDGLFRLDVARGLYPKKQTRVDLYLEARF